MSDKAPENEGGSFIGGTFGRKKPEFGLSTAEELDAEGRGETVAESFAGAPVVPAEAQEFETGAGSEAADEAQEDVEGVSDEQPPGERNEPV